MASKQTDPVVLSPAERRERNRQQMKDSILAAAREVMLESGVASLNMNEVARRVQLRPQSLAEYFPNKAALYDALFELGLELFRDADEAAWRDHPPGWEQIEAWFAGRYAVAAANPDLYHLVFDTPAPDYTPSEFVIEITRTMLMRVRWMVASAIAAGAMTPGITTEQAADVLLAMRRGLVAERIGKARFVPADDPRFQDQIPIMISILQRAWGSENAIPTASGFDTAGGGSDA